MNGSVGVCLSVCLSVGLSSCLSFCPKCQGETDESFLSVSEFVAKVRWPKKTKKKTGTTKE